MFSKLTTTIKDENERQEINQYYLQNLNIKKINK